MTLTATRTPDLLDRLAPGGFVLLWSTGFIGAKFGLPYAAPMVFLAWRFLFAAGLLGGLALLAGVARPERPIAYLHAAVAGLLIQGAYLGGVFEAISHGMPAGISAMIVSLQPLLTGALVGLVLRERVSPRQWLGLALGLVGVALVLWEKLSLAGLGPVPVGFALAALVGITAGTLYQKRFGGSLDARANSAIQYAVCAALFWILAPIEGLEVAWTGSFVFALGWLTLALSCGAIMLFLILIERGSAARVASLMYLVPPVTALIAFLMFGEQLGLLALAGLAVIAVGVALVNR